jgi:O-acetyl-ADP-ribose deacetylase (regulator of RNase III)
VIRVVVDDLAFVAADAIVRPATALLEPTAPALRRLEQAGGAAFWNQVRTDRELAVGSAVVTGGGALAVELVIHAIIRSVAEPVTRDTVRRALTAALQRAADWQLGHLALPPLGTGAGGLALEDAAEIMGAIFAALPGPNGFPRDVTIVVENEEEHQVVEAFIRNADQ